MNNSKVMFAFAVFYAATTLTINYQLGFITFDKNLAESLIRDASAAFVAPILTGALVVCNVLILQIGSRSLAHISMINKSRAYAAIKRHYSNYLRAFFMRSVYLYIMIGVCLALIYAYSSGFLHANADTPYRWVMVAQIVPFWISMVTLVATIFRIHQGLRLLLVRSTSLSLFESEKLQPINDFLFATFFIYCINMCIYLLVTLFVPLLWIDIMILVVLSFVVLFVLVTPVNLIKTTISTQKENTINAINFLLSKELTNKSDLQDQSKGEFIRRLVDDRERLQHTADLLLIRKEVKTIPSLPVTLPTLMKFFLILLIPFFSWVGSGLVSQLLKLVV